MTTWQICRLLLLKMHVDDVWYINSSTSVNCINLFAVPVCFYYQIYFQIQIKYWIDIPLSRTMESETRPFFQFFRVFFFQKCEKTVFFPLPFHVHLLINQFHPWAKRHFYAHCLQIWPSVFKSILFLSLQPLATIKWK